MAFTSLVLLTLMTIFEDTGRYDLRSPPIAVHDGEVSERHWYCAKFVPGL